MSSEKRLIMPKALDNDVPPLRPGWPLPLPED